MNIFDFWERVSRIKYKVDTDELQALDRDTEIAVFCKGKGISSNGTKSVLESAGYTRVHASGLADAKADPDEAIRIVGMAFGRHNALLNNTREADPVLDEVIVDVSKRVYRRNQIFDAAAGRRIGPER